MGSISDALKRAEQERQRMRGGVSGVEPSSPMPAVEPPPLPEPGLASVVFRERETSRKTTSVESGVATPMTTAVRQSVAEPPPLVKRQQAAAETIVEDYASKQRLALPASIAVYHERSGAVAEQYRKIRQRLMEANPKREPTALVITSTRAGEGKTVTAINLALSLVEVRTNRVLLIDGDLHRGTMSRMLHLDHEMGFSELVTGDGEAQAVEGAIKATPWHNLFVLPSGARNPPQAATELLKLPGARGAIRHARGMFDWVLIDSPAAGSYPDAGLLGSFGDGIILAVSLNHTPRDEVQRMVRRLASMNLSVRGCVLTRHEG